MSRFTIEEILERINEDKAHTLRIGELKMLADELVSLQRKQSLGVSKPSQNGGWGCKLCRCN